MPDIETIITLQRAYIGDCTHEVRITRIGKYRHCRVFANNRLNQEVRVNSRSLISVACKEMLRIEDKRGNISNYASKSRDRRK